MASVCDLILIFTPILFLLFYSYSISISIPLLFSKLPFSFLFACLEFKQKIQAKVAIAKIMGLMPR